MNRATWIAAAVIAAFVAGLSAAPDPTTEDQRRDYGSLLFRIYCSNCHGESGAGDGPTAKLLTVAPSDLTRIRARSGGEFPERRIYRVIDGREVLVGHGRREMPIWGLGFQQPGIDADQEGEVRTRILALIEHLKSIQVPADGD